MMHDDCSNDLLCFILNVSKYYKRNIVTVLFYVACAELEAG